MTRKIFWENPYRKRIETRISSVCGSRVMVEETIFFAFSGGQESDSGTIGSYPVLGAEKIGTLIKYQLPDSHELREGDRVSMDIDWERRYAIMRLHFAAELVLEIIYRKLAGIEKIGAHIGENKARIDFKWETNIGPVLSDIASEVAAIVQNDLDILSAYSDEAGEKRYWEIPSFARVPCSGTHLKKTGEVGSFQLKRKNIGKGKERAEILLA